MPRALFLALALAALSGCNTNFGTSDPDGGLFAGSNANPAGGTGGSVSYSTQIAPLLTQNCAGCHAPGQLGSDHVQFFDASGQPQYQVVSSRINDIVTQVSIGAMPQGRPPLSQQAIAELKAWAQAGAPQN